MLYTTPIFFLSVPDAYQYPASENFSGRLIRGDAYQLEGWVPGSGTLIQGTYYCHLLPIRGDAYQVEARAPGSGTLNSRGRLPGPELAGWVRDAKLRDA